MNKSALIILFASIPFIAGCTITPISGSNTQEKTPTPAAEVATSMDVHTALDRALDDEYKARTTYEQVIARFGSVRPFSNIINAETQHISSLKNLYIVYNFEIPENPYINTDLLNGISSVSDACAVGVQAEIDNAALYRDTLLPAVVNQQDITTVFTSLMNASQNNHLPAFERCGGGGAK